MLSSIEIRNYQSLSHIKLELLPLTVIVGASSSGKSAFARAVRTLTSNNRGNAFTSHGERLTVITAVTDRGTVTLKRGKATTDNEYVLIPADPNEQQPPAFTKLGGEVPPEVSEFIGIAAKDPINYAGQFDKPYLLAESAGEVARVLGALTNVNIIFEASREANTRRTRLAAEQRIKNSDLEVIKAKIPEYRPLKAQRAALDEAETALTDARATQVQITRLAAMIDVQEQAEQLIEKLEPIAARTAPDIVPITDAVSKLERFQDLVDIVGNASAGLRARAADLEAATERLATLDQQYLEILVSAHQCPTCHQSTEKLEHVHG